MTTDYRFILQPYRGLGTRHTCPACGKKRSFARYIDNMTGEAVHPTVGRCNREDKCNYHLKPIDYFRANEYHPEIKFTVGKYTPPVTLPDYIPMSLFEASQKRYEDNNLVKYLTSLVGPEMAMAAVRRYAVGTSRHWPGSTVFWQVDESGNVHAGKVMLYDEHTGHRMKSPLNNYINWVHKLIGRNDFNLNQCFFGQHLLPCDDRPIAIVESEKTAVIASIYLPKFTWIASGGKGNLSIDKVKSLRHRNITLFPDLGAFGRWENIAKEMNWKISTLLEEDATDEERKAGLDIADYLVRFNVKEFSENNKNKTEL